MRLGELHITEGRGLEASRAAERVLLTEPYLERAYRLSIAARLVAGDGTGTAVAVKRLEKALADIGVEPEPVTRILLRQAAPRSAGR